MRLAVKIPALKLNIKLLQKEIVLFLAVYTEQEMLYLFSLLYMQALNRVEKS